MGKCCKGQSLVEVVVAAGAMSLLLVALLALMSLSLRNSRLSRDRAAAVAKTAEGVELMRAYRDYDWNGFLAKANGTNYNLPNNWVVEDGLGAACGPTDSRCVRLSPAGGQVEVAVAVSWAEGGQTFATSQNTQLSLWER